MAEQEMARWSRSAPTPANDTSFEVELDEQPEATAGPVYVDVTARTHEKRPIIPAAWRGKDNIKASAKWHAARLGHITGYHASRLLQVYVPLALFWSVVGVFKLAGRQIRWWFVTEAFLLEQAAASRGDKDAGKDWRQTHREAKYTRRYRGIVLGLEVVALVVCVLWLTHRAPLPLQLLVIAVAVPILAHIGRPIDRPIVSPAVVTPRLRKLNSDIVLRAYEKAGLSKSDKPDERITFGSTMARDPLGQGSQVVVDLPHGTTFSDVTKAKEKLASGLDVTVNQVFLTADKTSNRRHLLFVADRDPLALPVGKTDLLDCKPRNIWQPMRFGRDERDRLVTLALLWVSVLVGAQPRKGKTFSARLMALYAALDPWVKLLIVDGKNSPDWDKFKLVAHRIIFGTHPNPRTSDPIGQLLDMLDEILRHIDKVNEVLSQLPVDLCPEGKLTEELARDPRFPDLRIWLLVMEEFQVYFETEDQEINKQIAMKLSRIQATGPSAGVIILSSSQKPSGVGAGDVGRLFNRYRDNHAVRFALKCGNRTVSEAVLGGDAYSEGYDASALPVGREYLGIGYLYGAEDNTPTVRTFLADRVDVEKILTAARKHRETFGTLSGYAAGEEAAKEALDVLADVLRVFSDIGRPAIHWQRLAEILSQRQPEQYDGITAEAIRSLVCREGVPTANQTVDGVTLKGCRLEHIEAAINRRQIQNQ